jgi:hypothetical protein
MSDKEAEFQIQFTICSKKDKILRIGNNLICPHNDKACNKNNCPRVMINKINKSVGKF